MLMDFIQMIGQLFPKKSLHVTFPRHFYRFWNEHTMFGSYDRQYSACCITIYLTYLDNFERWVDSFVFFLSDKWSIFSIWCMYNMYLNGWVLYIVLNINMLFQDLEGVSEFDQRSSSAFSSLRQSPKNRHFGVQNARFFSILLHLLVMFDKFGAKTWFCWLHINH